MAVKFKANYEGIGSMLRAPWMIAEMLQRAEAVKTMAEEIAPVYEQGPHPGRYRDSFYVTCGVRKVPPAKTKRAFGRVTNDAPEAVFVEFGNSNTPRHATLRNALHLVVGKNSGGE